MTLRNCFACTALLLIAPLAAAGDTGTSQAQSAPGLVIRAGESWIFTVKDGRPVNPRRASEKAKPAKGEILATLEFEGNGSTLAVTSNDEVWWNYRAFIVTKPGHKGNRTSTCTLMNGERTAIEQWPDAIPAIRLADFTFASDGQIRCG